jgi:alkanesulfonate monooxygenase SsuD/methylene tetrahydromethanopterin reductase-like flavin-dependent oxidoreductase (luciferase family)
MGEVLQFCRRDKGFDTEITAVLITAYERTVAAIEQSGQPHGMCEIAARRIIAMASKGERNPDRLCTAALATVAKSGRRRPEPPVRLGPHLVLIDTRQENAGDRHP